MPYGDLDALEAVLDNRVAAVIVEPIQAEAGVVIPPDGYLAGVAERCLRRGVMLIVDETQTALRTGSLLVSTRQRVLPDILCLSRGIANGLPIGVMVTRTEVARRLRLRPGWHDSTDASNPLICAAATATLRIATNPTLQGHVNSVGDYSSPGSRHSDSPESVRSAERAHDRCRAAPRRRPRAAQPGRTRGTGPSLATTA